MKKNFTLSLVSVVLMAILITVSVPNGNMQVADAAPRIVTTTFSNTAAFALPANGSNASSTINVSGVTGNVTDVNVTIYGYNTTAGESPDFLLVGPGGQTVMLLSFTCTGAVPNVTYTFDDAASGPLIGPGNPCDPSGTYLPSDYGAGDYAINCVTGTAPSPPYGSALSTYNGVDPNGTWTLWGADYCGLGGGDAVLNGGWSIEIVDDSVVGGGGAPLVAYDKINQVRVTAPGSPLYESAGGNVVRDAGGNEIWVPNATAHNPYEDVYDVTDSVEIDGTTWVEIFIGNAVDFVWLPVGPNVQLIY